MAEHVQFTVDSGVQVYFCDPRSPWQRGTNQNTNRLLRQYLAKSADLRQLDQACYRRRAQRPPSTNPCLQDTLTSTRRGVALTPETASVSATAASPLGTYGIGRAATRSTLPPATAAVTTSRVRSTAARDALEWPRWRRIPTQSAQVGLANSLANAVAGSGPRGRSVAGRCLSCWFGVEPPAGIEPATPSLPSMVGPFGGQRGTSLRSIEQQVAGRIDDREMGVLRGGMRRGCWQITGTHADHSWASQGQVATMQTAANCQGFWCEQSLQVRLGGSSSQSEKAHSAVPEWRGHGC
jgi:hypothetical protein